MASTGEQIARMAGVSVSTVSRVLNNTGPVSDQTRKAILAAVEASGSTPKILGPRRASRSGDKDESAKGLIDVVMIRRMPSHDDFFDPQNRVANSYFRHLVDAVIDQVQRVGCRAVVEVLDDLPEPAAAGSYSGLVLLGDNREGLQQFARRCGCPIVVFASPEKVTSFDHVGIDNFGGISAAFDHLYQLGHRKIAYIAGSQKAPALRERFAAYRMKLMDAGLPLRQEWVFTGHCSMADDQRGAEQILRLADRPSAIIGCYDGAAIAVRRAAEATGLSVPRDLSVVGFDDQGLAELFTPPLTTVRVPVMQMARHAIGMLMDRMQRRPGEGSDACGIRVTPSLIIRESTAAPKT